MILIQALPDCNKAVSAQGCAIKIDKAYIIMKKSLVTSFKKGKMQLKQLLKFLYTSNLFLNHKRINLKCSNVLNTLFGYFFPFLNDVTSNFFMPIKALCSIKIRKMFYNNYKF